jgi:hypothetical protein
MLGEHIKGAMKVRAASAVVCSLWISFLSGCGAPGVALNPGALPGADRVARGQSAPRGGSVRPHVLTWGLLGGVLGTHKITWAQAAPYLTWAMTGSADSVAIRAVGIKTAVYTNPNRQGRGGPMYTNDEATFAHDCSGHRIYATNLPGHALMNVESPHLWLLWQAYILELTVGWGGVFDAIYEDAADSVQYATGIPCNFDQHAWTIASNTMNRSTGAPIFYNGLELFSGYGKTLGVSPSIALNATSIGGEAEGCYTSYTPNEHKPHRYEWQAFENTEIAMYGTGKLFLCGGANPKAASAAIAERIYEYASFLLTYNPDTTMIAERFATRSGLKVEPESELVALQPLTREPSNISDLLLSTGVYGREYGACYIKGAYVGRCAAVVNSEISGNNKSFPWPGKYHHTLALAGGGVLDGGTISTNGPPPPATIAGEEAVIVF